ncbi:MAG: hypothetical protein NZM09_05815 [Ignavibacterium sp.]|nr:hypothetical protein [Ignavibacterium sp.]MDW8375195.1 hypothetical protein [Ignavibacteriales bacterium]
MKKIIRHIFAFYLIASLTLGGVGIELFKHVCSSHSFNSVSIVDKPKCNHDNHTNIVENCCSEDIIVEQISCCEEYYYPNLEKVLSITSSEQCCESYSELKKIEELLFPPADKKVLVNPIHFIITQETDLSENTSQLKFEFQNRIATSPFFGRNLLNLIHQLKIDTPVC